MKKNTYLLIAIILMIAFPFIPNPNLSFEGMQVLGIFLGLLLLWIKVGMDWPSLLGLFMLGLLPSVGFSKVFSLSFGNVTFAFLLFTFICTYAFQQTVYPQKIAILFIKQPWATKSIWNLISAFLLAVGIFGLFMSPTVLFFIFLPIVEEICSILKIEKGSKSGSVFILGLIFICTITSGMTPIAHIFPILSMGVLEALTQISMSYMEYMFVAFPLGVVLIILYFLYTKYLLRNESVLIHKEEIQAMEIQTTTTKDKYVLTIFVSVILLWVLPSLISNVLPEFAGLISGYGTAMPPLLGTIILCVLNYDKKPLLNLNEALTKGVSWPALMMVSATLALGSVMTMESIGIMEYLQASLSGITTSMPAWSLILIFVVWAGIQSNVSSHMVTAQVVTSIAIPVSLAMGTIDISILTILIGFMASFGFATPPSMPYVPTSIGLKWITTQEVLKQGSLLTLVAIVITFITGVVFAIH